MLLLPYISKLRWRPIKGNVLINNAAILADTSISSNISSTFHILNTKVSIQQGMHKTHIRLCVLFVARKILNTDLDRSHFAANRTVRGERNAGRQVATKGKYTQMALTD